MNAMSPETLNHAPGPWFSQLLAGGSDVVYTIFGPGDKQVPVYPVAECWSEANARLIAEAPNMLRCLSLMVDGSNAAPEVVAAARAILARLEA